MKKNIQPPKWVNSLLQRFCRYSLFESIEGDLYELFLDDLENGKKFVKLRYTVNAILFLRYRRMRAGSNNFAPVFQTGVFLNQLKVSFRFLNKEKSITLISILGLVLTFVASTLIYQYISFEEEFDQWNPNKKEVYRVQMDNYTNDSHVQSLATSFSALGPHAMEAIPEVDDYLRLFGFSFELNHNAMHVLDDSVERDWFNGEDVFISTPSFFKFFPREKIYGSLALDEPSTVVISKSLADKYYPGENPVGQFIHSDFLGHLKIAGVFEDFPSTSHLQVEMLLPWDKVSVDDDNNWRSLYNTFNYLQIKDPFEISTVEEKLNKLYLSHQIDRHKAENTVFKFQLQPVTGIHLAQIDLFRDFAEKGNPNLVRALKLISLTILLMGMINYFNLMISRSKERLKEIGIRRILSGGSSKAFNQFFTEGLIIVLASLFLSILISQLVRPAFNSYLEIDNSHNVLFRQFYWIGIGILTFVILALAGGYPALSFRKMKTAKALKGRYGDIQFNISLRRALTTLQFVGAIFLVFISLVIFRQLEGMQNQQLGFSPEQVVVMPTYQTSEDKSIAIKYDQLIDQLSNHAMIHSATVGSSVPGYSIRQSLDFRGKASETSPKVPMQSIRIDRNYFETFNIEVIAGRGFEEGFSEVDFQDFNMVINETAARALGYENPQDAVGNYMYFRKDGKCKIIGVAKDFNQKSLHHTIEPITFYTRVMNRNRFFSVRFDSNNSQTIIDLIRSNWEDVFPNHPFEYFFLDRYYAQQYEQDHVLKNVISLLTGLILFISAIGLLGIISLIINQRTKELGIRKVLGATTDDFFGLLSREYIIIIGIALLIGWPVSYWAANSWLKQYAWKIELTWFYGLVPFAMMIAVSFIAMSLRIGWISRINPSDVLRSE